MLKAEWCRYDLRFRFLAKTSREEMTEKTTYFVKLTATERPGVSGLGECALFRGLSADDIADYEQILSDVCKNPSKGLPPMSSIRFGFETAFADLANGATRKICDNPWLSQGKAIAINGLIWMGDKPTMTKRVKEKIERGFKILKLKIGGIGFDDELSIIKSIRDTFGPGELEIRLDANGSFSADNVYDRLQRLSRYGIHSIEQPVRAGQHELMRKLCQSSPVAIALDEELIGFRNDAETEELLTFIRPQFIILKPALCGGFERADKWIETAEKNNIGWWATSALESNIGLNAIAQWVSAKDNPLVQGLGTGELYENNIQSPLAMDGGNLVYRHDRQWQIPQLPWQR